MDLFTQRMLERAKSRREKLDNQKMILEQRSPVQQSAVLNKHIDSNDDGIVNGISNRKGKQFITAIRKSKLQKLAKFYSSNDENMSLEDEEFDNEENVSVHLERKSKCKLGKLNELASKIKQWEDDLSSPLQHIANPEPCSDVFKNEDCKDNTITEKPTIWDTSMVEKLCSQGFSRSISQAKLLYSFEEEKQPNDEKENSIKILTPNSNKISEPICMPNEKIIFKIENSLGNHNEVLKKAAFFESTSRVSPNKSTKDPAELPLAERKALFERNKDEAVLPKKNFFSERKLLEKVENFKKKIQTSEFVTETSMEKEVKEKKDLFEEKLHLEKQLISQKEVIPVLNMTNQDIPEPPPMPLNNPVHQIASETLNFKDNEKKNPKSGRLYPSLSNLDITSESEMSNFNESKSSNLCLNMTLSELLELNKDNPTTPPNDRSYSKLKGCKVLNKKDKSFDDALSDISSSGTEEDSDDKISMPSEIKKSSSFEFKSGFGNTNSLLHTVSFYRKQQQNSCVAIENAEEKMDATNEEKKESMDESILVEKKIAALIAEINKQQTIISQASQALNLCLSTVEFYGSGEQVEGERLLLLASHKRQSCLNELQRLKVENKLWPQEGGNFLTERGDVNLTNICIKLKRDALRSIAAAENLQYFVCLIKSDEQVLATPVVSVSKENLKSMALEFPGQIKLENLLSNFKITVEVYNMELSKELLPHDIKYHIINKKDKKLLTPIKSKKSESKLVKPNLQSPAGPNAVRTTNFQLCGYIVFSLREITRTQWILNKVPYISPVEGTISMTIQSELRLNDEFRGFLTMFDDICGFGAWHRRWCLLSSHFISYWKYPDDEIKKVPIGTIDLRSVITDKVDLVSRDICARLNTFLLETTRPKLNDDKNSLVMNVKDDVTTIRHLLSADSRQEMTTWCKKLNTALALLRSWKCKSLE